MILKLALLVVFFAVTVGVGIYCRKKATDVNGFVLGGRAVGPWLTASAFGTSYFSAVIFVGYAGQFGWNFGVASTWIGLGNAFISSLMAWVVLGSVVSRPQKISVWWRLHITTYVPREKIFRGCLAMKLILLQGSIESAFVC